jgi:hypothetical protein
MHVMNDDWVPNASWQDIHENIRRLRDARGELDFEIGRWLLAARREGVHRRFGLASFEEYADRMFGHVAREAREKIRVATELEALPKIRDALRTGNRAWSAVREMVRIATPDTEDEWMARTERMTVRQVEAEVTGRKRGDRPSDDRDLALIKRRLVVELTAEDYVLVIDAFERIRKGIGPQASNAEALRVMAEGELGGRPERKAAYQTSITICRECERAWQPVGSEMIEVDPAMADCARCDGEIVGFTRLDEGEAAAAHVGQEHVAPATTSVGPASDALTARLERAVEHGGARMLLRLATRAFGRGRKTVTPRTRLAVKARDKHRCVVPGCKNFRFVELHHDIFRAHGGTHDAKNIVSLCTAHHRASHDGTLAVEVKEDGRIEFRHAGGTLYGGVGLADLERAAEARARAPAAQVPAEASERAELLRDQGRDGCLL